MRKKVILAIASFAMVSTMAGAASAQTVAPAPTPAGQYPNLASLQPFSAEANFMSLPGDLRYLVFQHTSQWLTRPEADRVVSQERGL
jgi:hypothetical protein